MNIILWYVSAIKLLTSSVIIFFFFYILFKLSKKISFIFERELPQKYLLLFFRINWKILFWLLFYSTIIVRNILCIIFRTTSLNQSLNHSAIISIINMDPLFFNGRINVLTNIYGLNYRRYCFIHRWLDRIAILESLFHSIDNIFQNRNFTQLRYLSELIVSI